MPVPGCAISNSEVTQLHGVGLRRLFHLIVLAGLRLIHPGNGCRIASADQHHLASAVQQLLQSLQMQWHNGSCWQQMGFLNNPQRGKQLESAQQELHPPVQCTSPGSAKLPWQQQPRSQHSRLTQQALTAAVAVALPAEREVGHCEVLQSSHQQVAHQLQAL